VILGGNRIEWAHSIAPVFGGVQNEKRIIVIDEVQKIPDILNEVHWLIENKNISFLLTGSSARKLKRGHSNLLGGRAWRRNMMPLSYLETTDFNPDKQIAFGTILPNQSVSKTIAINSSGILRE